MKLDKPGTDVFMPKVFASQEDKPGPEIAAQTASKIERLADQYDGHHVREADKAVLGGSTGWVGLPPLAKDASPSKTQQVASEAAGLRDLADEDVAHAVAWLECASEYTTLSRASDPDCEHIDAFKARVIDTLRKNPSLCRAQQAANWIAALHNKPNHVNEIEATVKALYGNDPRGEMIVQAARLIPLGEHLSSSALLRGGSMTLSQKEVHIFPINARAADLLDEVPGGALFAQAIRGDRAEGATPYLHAVRDLSAMDAPRAWRKNQYPPDGRLPYHEVVSALRVNDEKPGRTEQATTDVLARFAELVLKRSNGA